MLDGKAVTPGEYLAKATVPVARVSRLFGSDGELIINLFDTFPQDFQKEEPLFVLWDGLVVPLFFERFERRGRAGALVVVSDMQTRRRAEELLGRELRMLFAQEEEVTPSKGEADELFLEDLVGLHALLQPGAIEGVITDFIDGENPLFELKVRDVSVYIPAVDEFIVETDMEQGVIEFELPEGLLELYLES